MGNACLQEFVGFGPWMELSGAEKSKHGVALVWDGRQFFSRCGGMGQRKDARDEVAGIANGER